MRLVFVIAATAWWTIRHSGFLLGTVRDFAIGVNVQIILVVATLAGCEGWFHSDMLRSLDGTAISSLLIVFSLSILFFDHVFKSVAGRSTNGWSNFLRVGSGLLALWCFLPGMIGRVAWQPHDVMLAAIGLGLLATSEFVQAILRRCEKRVWLTCGIVASILGLLWMHEFISIGVGPSQLVLLALGIGASAIASLAARSESFGVLRRPTTIIGLGMPGVVTGLAVAGQLSEQIASSSALDSLVLMIASGV